MRAASAVLLLSLICPAYAIETSGPAFDARVPSFPVASAAFAQNLSGVQAWLRTNDGLRAAVGIDAELAALATLDQGELAFALGPCEPHFSGSAPSDPLSLLRELSKARKAAAPDAARLLGERLRAAQRGGLEDLERLQREARGYTLFGGDARKDLDDLSRLVYEKRVGPVAAQAEPWLRGKTGQDLARGTEGAGAPRLERGALQSSAKTAPPAPAKKPDLKVRALTAALLVPSIIALVHLGGAAFVAFTTLLAGLSLREYAGMLRAGGRLVQPRIASLSAVALAIGVALHAPVAPLIAGTAAVAGLRELMRPDHSFERAANTVFGALLFGFLPAHLALVRGFFPFGERITLMLFASAWMTDTTAYFFGRRWGSHKIAPRISPNKTWEGATAGFFGAMAAVLGFWLTAPAMMPLWAALAVGLVMGIAGQASGYLNSMIKRANGVKDSGNLLPGHGGVIDRFDTFVLAAPLVYYLLSLI